MRRIAALELLFPLFLAAPLLAQTTETTIGGGTCSSSYLNGTYAISISGRQVNSSGTFVGVLQANGTATFDGLSAVTITTNQNTVQALGTPLSWSGTYSVQANCVAVATITSGGNAILNIMISNQGRNFLLTGNDGTYSYSGSGNQQPASATCSASTLNGVYTYNGTGDSFSANAVTGVTNGAGLLQFDGLGNLTANISTVSGSASTSSLTLSGTYNIAANCTGTATLTDTSSHSYTMSISLYSLNATNTNFFATLASSGNFMLSGGGHTAYAQSGAGTCSASMMNGTYSLSMNGRAISSTGAFAGSSQGIGTATFDGNGNVILAGTANTNFAQGKTFSFTGTYTMPSSCSGTLTLSGTSFTLLTWANGTQFAMVGADSTCVYSAAGGLNHPVACATATLSGLYTFTASGFTLSGTTQTGAQDEAGVLLFDGQGNVAAKYSDTQAGMTPVSENASGTYAVTSGCSATATLADSAGKSHTFNLVVFGPHGETADLLGADPAFVRTGSAHSAFTNPSQAIGNVASYVYSATPPGSVFALFGQNLATHPAGAVTTPLPTKLVNTTVTINGELAPLFYVDANQVDAQMPWDIPGNSIASVVVTNGSSVSNAAAIYVPATGTPGISTYANNRAVLVNANGTNNAPSSPANVGDEVVVYFTGGGPVMSQVNLQTGKPAGDGLSPVTGDHSITVGGIQASIDYIGLTPGSIGLYQANFIVPQLVRGTYPIVITIAGFMSNAPVMNVGN